MPTWQMMLMAALSLLARLRLPSALLSCAPTSFPVETRVCSLQQGGQQGRVSSLLELYTSRATSVLFLVRKVRTRFQDPPTAPLRVPLLQHKIRPIRGHPHPNSMPQAKVFGNMLTSQKYIQISVYKSFYGPENFNFLYICARSRSPATAPARLRRPGRKIGHSAQGLDEISSAT